MSGKSVYFLCVWQKKDSWVLPSSGKMWSSSWLCDSPCTHSSPPGHSLRTSAAETKQEPVNMKATAFSSADDSSRTLSLRTLVLITRYIYMLHSIWYNQKAWLKKQKKTKILCFHVFFFIYTGVLDTRGVQCSIWEPQTFGVIFKSEFFNNKM